MNGYLVDLKSRFLIAYLMKLGHFSKKCCGASRKVRRGIALLCSKVSGQTHFLYAKKEKGASERAFLKSSLDL
ncbi:MAG: hypothetical protein CMK09_09960 [Ponticaulis sp.]|nr:hypothetical protein [Ponticaulis sp.]